MRVAVAMSGGVDSSVTAYLLEEEGWEVIGVTLHLLDTEDPERAGYGRCCSAEDIALARKTAEILGIPHYIIDRTHEFSREVIEPFVRGYGRGITPNPCVTCNERVKFSTLFRLMERLNCDLIATGHYARILRDPRGIPRLLRGKDRRKDQSYFLFTLKEADLKRILFPLGERTKDEVREIARARGLPSSSKPDSQDLCFLYGTDLPTFLKEHGLEDATGEIVGEGGEVYGTHSGIYYFTIGQRRGLGVSTGEPLYVKRLDPVTRRVIVAPRFRILQRAFGVESVRWIHGAPSRSLELEVAVRYRSKPLPARVEREEEDFWRVEFLEGSAVVTPGQVAVFYQGEEVVGGGWISPLWES
jgi:tRNA-specific 2-thiouridylase